MTSKKKGEQRHLKHRFGFIPCEEVKTEEEETDSQSP